MKTLLVSLMLVGCGYAVETYDRLPMPGDCSNPGGAWLIYDCPGGVGSECRDDAGAIRASGCILRTPEARVYCVAACE